jgi:hypothetical protein
MQGKDASYWRILNAAILLDLRLGHQKWSLAQLARSGKVARSLIYYYFGRSKFDILVHAVKLIGYEVSGQSDLSHKLWQQGQIAESLIATRVLLAQSPALGTFYFVNRDKENEIGSLIRKHEEAFGRKISKYFPKLTPTEIKGLHALINGVVFTSWLKDDEVRDATKIILKGLNK